MTQLLLTVPQAAQSLGISRSKFYELITSGTVASIKIDGSRRVPVSSLQEYIQELLTKGAAA
ncbi:helix-turn-helix domain-containing protein [Sinosporangium siamense]|uniref:Helix-turn-helix domain-containing protein n=1 Tax=Sinosporangium siamense TaxID=1367973 RepID=A0A919VF49_9ACTN|nr:helix-turn-helix domain-containing protein [Sinosporangium siamense]GII95779.1 hypothetical protein Ssi02_60100 [Sinosporangium siamense]